ncbi:MAG: hypothetical protein HDR03_10615 [Lachnospiraceae bacterium]|nr:hypothetical protein [Lachnospiraceae bacterium]
MEHLRHLHDDMVANNVNSSVFNTIYNAHEFSCIFIKGTTNHQLYITTVENNPHTIWVTIGADFQAPNHLDNEFYVVLANYLGFTGSSNNRFYPINFFEEFDNHIPMHHVATPAVATMIAIICNARNVPDADKIYFVGWRKNSDGQQVSPENYLKTLAIVGEEVARNLRENNISSRWSDIPHDEQLHQINQYENIL